MKKAYLCSLVLIGTAGAAAAQLPSGLPSIPGIGSSAPSTSGLPSLPGTSSGAPASPTQSLSDKACIAVQNKLCSPSMGMLKQQACLLAVKSKLPKACKNTNNPASVVPGVSLPKL